MQSLFGPPRAPVIEPIDGRARAAVWCLVGNAITVASGFMHSLALRQAIRSAETGEPISLATAQLLDSFERVSNILTLATLIVAAVVYLRWVHRVHANLHSSGLLGMQYEQGTVVLGYFIPLVNLLRPYRAMREAWRGSHAIASGRPYPTDWASHEPHWTIGIWWASLIAGNGVSRAAMQTLSREPTLAEIHRYASLSITGDGLTLIAAAAIVYIVSCISAAQSAAADALERQRADAVSRPAGNGPA